MWIYINNPIWLKLNKAKEIFWSKDENLKKKLIETERFKDLQDDSYNFRIEKWIEKILNWEKIWENDYNAVYAFELIAEEIWEELPYRQDIKFWIETDYIDEFLIKDFWINEFENWEMFFGHNTDFFIPKQKDLPFLWIVTLEELKKYNEIFFKVNIDKEQIERLIDSPDEDEEEKWYAYEHIKWIKENIEYCVENWLDMVIFAY